MSGKNLVLQLWPKMVSVNLITVLFDHQYLWKESIHFLDFLYDILYLYDALASCTSCTIRLQDSLIINISPHIIPGTFSCYHFLFRRFSFFLHLVQVSNRDIVSFTDGGLERHGAL